MDKREGIKMLRKVITISLIFGILFSGWGVYASTETYSDTSYEQSWAQNGDTYCSPKKSFKEKLKGAFVGTPTGFSPQIEPNPSPYLNKNYGPSYNQGFYTGNTWNSHNLPYPNVSIFGKGF